MRCFALCLLLGGASAAFAADLTMAQLLAGDKVLEHDSVIVATSNAHEADMCRGFSLTESQVKDFFKRSAVLDEATLKSAYQWSPCEVQGYLLYRDQKFLYTVNAAATGRIETGPGRYVYFGCNTCRDIFDYGYVLPPAPGIGQAPAAATAPPR
ncbi:MAG TPA: hypothetical protein VGH91_01635 [Gammaproteobacteria bacterium]|jgi:hypothetical protein